MKKLLIGVSTVLAFTFSVQAQTAQQSKMTTCNKEVGDKKGDERKALMKTFLSAKPRSASSSGRVLGSNCGWADDDAKREGNQRLRQDAARRPC